MKKVRFRIGFEWYNPKFYISNAEIFKDAYTQRSKFPKYNFGGEFKITEKNHLHTKRDLFHKILRAKQHNFNFKQVTVNKNPSF